MCLFKTDSEKKKFLNEPTNRKTEFSCWGGSDFEVSCHIFNLDSHISYNGPGGK